jgi:hypothetical protein
MLSGESMTMPASAGGRASSGFGLLLLHNVPPGLLVWLATVDPEPRLLLADPVPAPPTPPCLLTTGSSMVNNTPVFIAISFSLALTSGMIVLGERPLPMLVLEGKRADKV